MEAYNNFKKEIIKLELLFAGSIYSYNSANMRHNERIKRNFIDNETEVTLTLGKNNIVPLSENRSQFNDLMKDTLPKYLREVVIIRLISIFEVFVVDWIKEVFVNDRSYFHTDDKSEFSVRYLLSLDSISDIHTNILNNECKKVQNNNFMYKVKYLKKKLLVNIDKYDGDLKLIEYWHDVRNILVHRLGVIDNLFLKKYKIKEKNIYISKKQINEIIIEIKKFVSFIKSHRDNYRKEDINLIKDPRCIAHLKFKVLKNIKISILNKNFNFMSGEKIVNISDIMYRREFDNENKYHLMKLSGSVEVIDSFEIHIMKHVNNSDIEIIKFKKIPGIFKNKEGNLYFSKQMKRVVSRMLPPEPYPKDIHRKIANKIGIKNNEAYKIINNIKNDEDLYKYKFL